MKNTPIALQRVADLSSHLQYSLEHSVYRSDWAGLVFDHIPGCLGLPIKAPRLARPPSRHAIPCQIIHPWGNPTHHQPNISYLSFDTGDNQSSKRGQAILDKQAGYSVTVLAMPPCSDAECTQSAQETDGEEFNKTANGEVHVGQCITQIAKTEARNACSHWTPFDRCLSTIISDPCHYGAIGSGFAATF